MKIIFKHSYRCPISDRAKREVDKFLEESGDKIDYELIDVIGSRERSNRVAEELGIKHESPQVIILDDDNRVTWSASHHKIKEKKIRAALEQRSD